MFGQARIGPAGVPLDGPGNHGEEHRHHHAINHGRMAHIAQHPAEHDDQREREEQNVDTGQEVAPGTGVLKRVRRVGPEETAAVGAQVLDRNNGRDRAAGDLLRQRLVFLHAHGPGFECCQLQGAFEGHRHAGGYQQDAHD